MYGSLQIGRQLRQHLRRPRLPAFCTDHQRADIERLKIGKDQIC